MKQRKLLGGLMILVSLTLASCNFGNAPPSSSTSLASETISSEPTTSVIDDSSEEVISLSSDHFDEDLFGYPLRTVSDLGLLSEHPDEHFYLMNDIDISNVDWVPIEMFSGKLWGQDHKIIGLTIEGVCPLAGFFATVDDIQIYDLTFENVSITVHSTDDPLAIIENAAGVVAGLQISSQGFGAGSSILDGVNVTGDVSITMVDDGTLPENALHVVGGLVGVSASTLQIENSNVKNGGTGATVKGGLIGYATKEEDEYFTFKQIWDNVVTGTIEAEVSAGGYIGTTESYSVVISRANNSATVTNLGGMAAGGFVGVANGSGVYISDSNNTGTITSGKKGDNPTATGGFIGMALSNAEVSFYKVFNSGEIRSNQGTHVAGFIGYIGEARNLTIDLSFNEGTIYGLNNVGGFVGAMQTVGKEVKIEKSYNVGSLSVGNKTQNIGGSIGGFIGTVIDADLNIKNSFNSSDLHAINSFAGGFVANVIESIVKITQVLHIGDISAASALGTFVGATTYNLQAIDAYYLATLTHTNGGAPVNPLYQGTAIEAGDINPGFFLYVLGLTEDEWKITDTSWTDLPTIL